MSKNISIDDTEEIELIDVNLDLEDFEIENLEDEEDGTKAADKKQPRSVSSKSVVKELISYLIVIIVAVGAAFLINRFIIVNANIPSRSMTPTVNVDDKLIGLRLAYIFDEPERFDVVIFEHVCNENKGKETLIKRIIGLPGDSIVITNGTLYVNGEEIAEDYIFEPMVGNFGPYTVPDNCYFMLGDHRNISKDSRYWENTFVDRDGIIAKAVLRYSPSFEVID